MPLSDREQQILQEIERQLYEQDPRFARDVAATTLERHALRNIRRGVGLFALGFLVLLAFFFTESVPVGVAAFLLMLAGATFAYQSARRLGGEQLKALRRGMSLRKFFGPLEDRLRDFRRGDEP